MLRGAIRSGAADETKSTWKAWLLASKKALNYQRHRIGHTAADDGVATDPPANIFEAARRFAAGEKTTDTTKHVARGVRGDTTAAAAAAAAVAATGAGVAIAAPGDDAGSELGLESGLEGRRSKWRIAGGVVRLLAEWAVAAVRFAGVPSVLSVFCLLLVVMQQRDVRRLTAQVEELVAKVDQLREVVV